MEARASHSNERELESRGRPAPSEPEAQLAGVPSDHYYEDAISRFAPLGLIDAPAVERLRALARHFPPPRLRKQIQLLLERRIGAADASVDLSVMVPADRDDGTAYEAGKRALQWVKLLVS